MWVLDKSDVGTGQDRVIWVLDKSEMGTGQERYAYWVGQKVYSLCDTFLRFVVDLL